MDNINKEKIFNELELQRKSCGLTFADMDRIFENNGFNYSGDRWVQNEFNDHVYYWFGWNMKACNLYWEYMKKYNLKRLPTNLLLYLTSGKVPSMPIVKAKSVKQFMKYKTDHWFPVQIVTKEEYDRA